MTDPSEHVHISHNFDRVEILCPDDRHHSHTQGALEIRVFGGVARRPDVIDSLSALQMRFMHEPGVRAVNIRRHEGCGFQLGEEETREAVLQKMRRILGRSPTDLQLFADPEEDLLRDLGVLKTLSWLEGTRFAGYVTDLHSSKSKLVGEFTASNPLPRRAIKE